MAKKQDFVGYWTPWGIHQVNAHTDVQGRKYLPLVGDLSNQINALEGDQPYQSNRLHFEVSKWFITI